MIKALENGVLQFEQMPRIAGYASVIGKKESEGPLSALFDRVVYDSRGGAESFESAESRLQQEAASLALDKSGLRAEDCGAVFAGDLLNQCIGSSFGLKDFHIPFLGQYGACSTMAQALLSGAVFVESGAVPSALCVSSSHFCAAERQYRFPLEYGSVRTPTAQWTVTGAGACVLKPDGAGVRVAGAAIGRIVDFDITDANHMGAAMAPAAAETILRFLRVTGTQACDYDHIFTGDLGQIGSDILCDLTRREGVELRGRHSDCGQLIFDREQQEVQSGGSGAGCCASVLCAKILREMNSGGLRNILFVATGALLSATTAGQGKSIPAIAHLVQLRA